MATPNYAYEKRQRELAKKKKQEEKDARKREARAAVKNVPAGTDVGEGVRLALKNLLK